jgi:hypothetical protein
MPLLLRFGFAAQVVAAFVIFVLGYVSLFVTLMLLMLLMLVIRGLYESAKRIHASAARRANTNSSTFTSNSTAGSAFERRAPVPITAPANQPALVGLTFHPTLNRRRVAVAANYSPNLPGGTPR